MLSEQIPWLWLRFLAAMLTAFFVAYATVPSVKRFAESIGAVDMPNARRINKVPVPRMGGIAIFCGFMLSALLFVNLSDQITGILIGCVIVAMMGGMDDVFNFNPWLKLAGPVAAALMCVAFGVVADGVTNFFFVGRGTTLYLPHAFSGFVTVLWIVGCTNAINLIDGLDGLAVGMSTISAITLFAISLSVEFTDPNVSVLLLCVIGACCGFWPYNRNPAKIFMGDVGSQMLGFLLASISVLGLFKMHALVTMLLPFLALAVPLADTFFAFVRRIAQGQSPFHPDKGHLHHRLLAMGLTQKQAVSVMYSFSIIFGIFAFLMIGKTRRVKIICLAIVFVILLAIAFYVYRIYPQKKEKRYSGSDLVEEDIKIYEKGRKRK